MLAELAGVIAGAAGVVFLESGQGAFVADLAECPDGPVSLSERVVLRLDVLDQRVYAIAGVLLNRHSADLLDARSDREAAPHVHGENKGEKDQKPVKHRLLEAGPTGEAL